MLVWGQQSAVARAAGELGAAGPWRGRWGREELHGAMLHLPGSRAVGTTGRAGLEDMLASLTSPSALRSHDKGLGSVVGGMAVGAGFTNTPLSFLVGRLLPGRLPAATEKAIGQVHPLHTQAASLRQLPRSHLLHASEQSVMWFPGPLMS